MTGILNALIAGVSGAVKDAYFNLVSLLLPGNGTNGAQNNTFLDGSSNNFTITRNGNTTQGTFSPFSQTGWGNYFDGSGDYLSSSGGAATAMGTGDFTWELFVFITAQAQYQDFIDTRSNVSAGSTDGFAFTLNTGTLTPIVYTTSQLLSSSINVTLNAWTHVALTRSGTTLTIWVNGVSGGTITNSTNLSNQSFSIGGANTTSIFTNGYISNVRMVKGTAVYTSAFTPPTAPLTAISGTSLLTCQSNRFRDASTNNFAITATGNVSVTPFSPFAPTQSYSASAVGGSGYFDGTGDYLTIPNVTALNLYNTTNTVECWVYLNSFGANGTQIYGTEFDATYYTLWFITSSGFPAYTSRSGTSITSPTAIKLNEWNHIVWGRSGSSVSIWINGTRSINQAITTEDQWGTGLITIGRFNGTDRFSGYLSGLRVVKGSDVYGVTNTSITVPTAPLTAITNTSLLLNFTNGGVIDATAKNVLETVGNAQISTTQSKWGGGSVYFDGLNSYLLGASSQQYEFGSGDFTIEAWVNISAAPGDGGIITKGLTGTIDTKIWSLEFVGSGTYPNAAGWYVNAASASFIITGTTNLKTSTWTHVAVCKSGNNTRLFVNGTQEGSTYTTGYTIASGGSLYVGTSFYAPTTRDITGYMDDLRITKFARYTGNFTPPSAPFALQ